MILADTGPLVALFDPADQDHKRCVALLKGIDEPLCTTIPVLTEAFHLLDPGSIGAQRLMDFVTGHGLNVWYLDDKFLIRMFELMVQYADHPMDLADASLVAYAVRLVRATRPEDEEASTGDEASDGQTSESKPPVCQ